MRSNNLLDDKYKAETAKKIKDKVEKEVEKYENMPDADPQDIFKYTFKEMTPNLKEEMEDIK